MLRFLVYCISLMMLVGLSLNAYASTYATFTCTDKSQVNISGSEATGYVLKAKNGSAEITRVPATGKSQIAYGHSIGHLTGVVVSHSSDYKHQIQCAYGYVEKRNDVTIQADIAPKTSTCHIISGPGMTVVCRGH